MNYTFGGIPEAQAAHWCTETYQELGQVVWLLSQGRALARREARNRYFYLKRRFMLAEWNEYLDRLQREMRAPRGLRSIEELVQEIGEEQIQHNHPLEHPQDPAMAEVAAFLRAQAVLEKPAPREIESAPRMVKCEQLSLF